MTKNTKLGDWGEEIAKKILADLGYAIVAQKWRMGHLEIDIIAKKDDVLVFAEVKTRAEYDEDPLEAVNNRKISHMIAAAEAYVQAEEWPYNVQFDLFGINGSPGNEYKVEHIPDAFTPGLRSYK